MKICPIAIAAGCARCPLVTLCPLKSVLGDWRPPEPKPEAPPQPQTAAAPKDASQTASAKPPRKPGASRRR